MPVKERISWTKEETMAAFRLYCRIPFGKIHERNPDIIELAKLLGRSAGAVSWKLSNLASFDETLRARNIRGAKNASKLDKSIWDEFNSDSSSFLEQCEHAYLKFQQSSMPQTYPDEGIQLNDQRETESKRLVKSGPVPQKMCHRILVSRYHTTH